MSYEFPSNPVASPRKGMAIASLIVGGLSLLSFRLPFLGGIIAIGLGVAALVLASKKPLEYGGKPFAIGGIAAGALSIIAPIVLMGGVYFFMNKSIGSIQQKTNERLKETDAIFDKLERERKEESASREIVFALKQIHGGQVSYKAAAGKFGTLKELAEKHLIDEKYAAGVPINGYLYSDSDVSVDGYCVHANRVINEAGVADFNISEVGVVYQIKSPAKGTVPHGQGEPMISGY